MKNKKYVHKDFYDSIEERIKDLNDFEADINADELDSVWFGMQDLLNVDNSVYNLKNLEVNVTDDIWANIENELVEKDKKPVVWWPYVAVAGTLLAIFSTISLNNYQNKTDLLVNIPIKNNPHTNKIFEKNNSKKQNKADKGEFSDEQRENVISKEIIENQEESSLIWSNDTKNTRLLASNKRVNQKNDLKGKSDIQESSLLSLENNILMPVSGENLDEGINGPNNIILPKKVERLDFANHINKVLPIKVLNLDKAIAEKNTLISYPFSMEEDYNEKEQSEDNRKRWKLLASVGMGNYQNIEKNFEWRASSQNRKRNDKASVYKKIEVDNNEGINKQSYHIPVSITLESQFDITEKTSIRAGITSTKLNYVYEIYGVGNEIEFNYLGISLGVALKMIEKGKFRINVNSEFRVEKMISSKYIVLKGDYVLPDAELDPIENFGVNTAASIGMDLQYRITPKSILFVRPKLTKYISTDTQLFYDRKEQLIWPELNIGYGLTL